MSINKKAKKQIILLLSSALNLFAFGLFIIMIANLYKISSPLLILLTSFVFTVIWLYMNVCLSNLAKTLTLEEKDSKGKNNSISLSNIFMVGVFMGCIIVTIISICILVINL